MLNIKEEVERTFSLTDEGNNFSLESLDENLIGDLTPDLIQSGDWKEKSFQRYGVEDKVEVSNFSTLHPLTRFTEEIRNIFLQMGFSEIEGDYVESAFWNMDALFIPQDHPARELQDTFYLSEPASFVINEKEILDAVKKIHEDGGETGSKGWGTDWSLSLIHI